MTTTSAIYSLVQANRTCASHYKVSNNVSTVQECANLCAAEPGCAQFTTCLYTPAGCLQSWFSGSNWWQQYYNGACLYSSCGVNAMATNCPQDGQCSLANNLRRWETHNVYRLGANLTTNTTVPPWYTPPGKPHASCPDVEHDDCCSCMGDEMQYGDWDSNHCCGACTNICTPPGDNGIGPPWWDATAPPPWSTMYPPPPGYNATGPPWWNVITPPWNATMYPPPPGYNATVPPWYSAMIGENMNQVAVPGPPWWDATASPPWSTMYLPPPGYNATGPPWWNVITPPWNATMYPPPPGYNATVPPWYSAMIGENMKQVAVVNSELAITLAFWTNSTEAQSPIFAVELEATFRRSIAEALNVNDAAGGSLWPLSAKHVYVNGVVGVVPGPGGAAAAQPWYYTPFYFPLSGTNGTTQPSHQNSTMTMLDDEDSQEEDEDSIKILFVNCTVILPALEFGSHTSGGIFVRDFVRRALSVGDPLSGVFQTWLKTRLSAHLSIAPVLNRAIKEVIDTAVIHPAGLWMQTLPVGADPFAPFSGLDWNMRMPWPHHENATYSLVQANRMCASHYKVSNNVSTVQECANLCAAEPGCAQFTTCLYTPAGCLQSWFSGSNWWQQYYNGACLYSSCGVNAMATNCAQDGQCSLANNLRRWGTHNVYRLGANLTRDSGKIVAIIEGRSFGEPITASLRICEFVY